MLHGEAPDIDELLDLLDPIVPRDEIVVGQIGPVIGTHAGPRVIGVTFQTVGADRSLPDRSAGYVGRRARRTFAPGQRPRRSLPPRTTIARGGMATVWVAEDPLLSRRVAVKILHPELAVDDGAAHPLPQRGDRGGQAHPSRDRRDLRHR